MANSSSSKEASIDRPLEALGFDFQLISASQVTGRLRIAPVHCQPFGVLHGGVSALIAESLASIGAHVASGFQQVAGIQLSINHFKTVQVGDEIVAEAKPVSPGRTIQVWEVNLWKLDPRTSEKGPMTTSSRVTLIVNLPVPKNAKDAEVVLRKHARL